MIISRFLFKGTYVIYKVNSGGVEWIALQPQTNVRLKETI